MSKHSSTYLAVGFTVNPLRSPSCTLRYSNPRQVTRTRGLRASPLLITTDFVICVQIFSSVAGLAQMRGSSTWDTTLVSFDSCTNRHRSNLQRLNPMCSVSIPVRNYVKSRLAVRMPFIAHEVSRSIRHVLVFSGGRANISQDESACSKAYTGLQFPLEDRTILHTAIVHALTMEKVLVQLSRLSLSSRNPSAHISISLHSPSIIEPNL